jgi:MerR family transcriptional regulator, copper efflux regulator
MSEEPIIACSLVAGEQQDRVEQWRRLLAAAVCREPVDRGMRFVLPVLMAGEVAGLAAAELECCPFFEFTLKLGGGRLVFEVCAPGEAVGLVAEVFGS